MHSKVIEALEELIDAKIDLALVTKGGVYAEERAVKSLEDRVNAASNNLWYVANTQD